MAESTQRVVSDGTLVSLGLSIDFIKQADISVFYDGLPAGAGTWSWTGPLTIGFSPAVPNGVEVLLRRATERGEVINVFEDGAAFNNASMDTNFKQTMFLAQEALEGAALTDAFADVDFHGFRPTNLGTAVNPGDAVSLAQYQADASGAYVSRLAAEAAADEAVAAASVVNPESYATAAQGAKADTALQPGQAATPAQGAKADTAVQQGSVVVSGLTQSTNRILGRSTASTGAVEELTTGSALEIMGGSLDVKAGGVTPAMLSQPVVELTPTATTSGTSAPYTGFPSTAKVIELDFNQVSESAGNAIRIQLGTSGGLVSSGYIGSNAAMTGGGYGGAALASGIDFRTNAIGMGARISGHLRLTHMGSNLWAFSGLCHDTANLATYTVGGSIKLGAALTQLSVLANGGTFDGPAGSSVGGRYF